MSYGQELAIRWLTLYFGPPDQIDYRPAWMDGLELDAWWAELRIGLEFQGDQHYFPLDGLDEFVKQTARDDRKHRICREAGIPVIHLTAVDLTKLGVEAAISRSIVYRTIKKRVKKRILATIKIATRPSPELLLDSSRYLTILRQTYNAPTAKVRSSHRKEVIRESVDIAKAISHVDGVYEKLARRGVRKPARQARNELRKNEREARRNKKLKLAWSEHRASQAHVGKTCEKSETITNTDRSVV